VPIVSEQPFVHDDRVLAGDFSSQPLRHHSVL